MYYFYKIEEALETHSQLLALKKRWNEEWALHYAQVKKIIHSNQNLDTIPLIERLVMSQKIGTTIKLLDLRGIDLSHLKISDVDLSYCCFDGASFINTQFDQTHLQLSTFRQANMEGATFNMAQMSSVSLAHTNLFNTQFNKTFLMGSDLENVDISSIKFIIK